MKKQNYVTKRLLALLLVCALCGTFIFAVCANAGQDTTEEPVEAATEAAAEPAAEEEEARVLKIGVLTMLNLSEEEMADYYEAIGLMTDALVEAGKAERTKGVSPEEVKKRGAPQREIVFYDSLDALLMALNAGDIDMISIYNATADYLTANNDQLVKGVDYEFDPDATEDFYSIMITDGILNNSFAFMMMEENEALRDEFNTAIASMREDGTLDTLIEEQMKEVVESGEAKPVEMPVMEGAETIRVAVTGSLPPMDYVAADGSPAGYNTAVLAEISNRIGKNIEIVVVDSVGRAAALSSGTVDAVFWTRSNDRFNERTIKTEEEIEERRSKMTEEENNLINKIDEIIDVTTIGQNDMPEGTIITESYFRDSIVSVLTKEGLERVENKLK